MACSNDILVVLKAVLPEDVYIQVGVANPLVNGGVAVQPNDTSFTIPSYAGWQVRLFRNKFIQNVADLGDGDTWYDYTSITGEFTPSTPAAATETFIAQAYKPA